MVLGSLEIQIFVSLVVVLGTAFVALVCDFLKGNNEQLRERNVELRVRHEERDRLGLSAAAQWLQGLATLARNSHLVESMAPSSGSPAPANRVAVEAVDKREPATVNVPPVAVAAYPEQPAPRVAEESPRGVRRRPDQDRSERTPAWASKEELEQLAERAARIRARYESAPRRAQSVPAATAVGSATAVVDSPVLSEPVRLRVLSFDKGGDRLEKRDSVAGKDAEGSEVLPAAAIIDASPVMIEESVRPVAGSPATPIESSDAVASPVGTSRPPERTVNEVVPPIVPPGMHPSSVLEALIQTQQPFSGVIVAIGINDFDSLREKLKTPEGIDSLAAAERMMQSVLRENDFACRFREDEFILLFPGESGAPAQRRLFQVSEKLWDFQLRSLGNLSLMFSWGGYEVQSESLSEAVASARERMFQTKRSRKTARMELSIFGKRVVNA
jgi:GGDEF domain-containing protein